MLNSIPAAPRVLDLSGDGLADRLYVGDMGGRLWRFDLVNGNDRADFGEGGVLASLGAADPAATVPTDVRRFYASPDVVLTDCAGATFLAVNLGSGYRGHPLDTDVADAFFSVRDTTVFGVIPTESYPAPIGAGNLFDITGDPAALVPRDSPGWRLRMVEDPGEKILTAAVTFNDTIFFNSFSPGDSINACVGGIGVNRAYAVDTCNGWPVYNLDASTEPGPLGLEDRFRTLSQAGIAAGPMILIEPEGAKECIGLTCFDIGGRTFQRTYWTPEPAR